MEAEKTCDSRTCTDEVSPTPYAVSKLGTRAVDACCALGGGFTNGMNLVMGKLFKNWKVFSGALVGM